EVESNRSVSSYARHVGPRYDSVIEVETVPGETNQVRVAAPASVSAFVLDGQWPEAGIDFRGTAITEDVAAEAESPSDQNVDEAGNVDVSGFEIGQGPAAPAAGTLEGPGGDHETAAPNNAGEDVGAETIDETPESGTDSTEAEPDQVELTEAEAKEQ